MSIRNRFRSNQTHTEVAPRVTPDVSWIGPWWLARQRDPDSAAYHPARTPTNAVGRSWTLVGNLDSGPRSAVDRRGLVTGQPGRWSLDWWVRAGEEWIFPSVTSGVRQRLVDGAPVVETVLRAGGGDVVHTTFAARVPDDATVVEITNDTSGPIAVALALRPYDVQGGGRITSVELNGSELLIDGRRAVVFEREPAALVAGVDGTDPAAVLDGSDSVSSAASDDGRASVAAVFPLVHGSTLRAALPTDGSNPTAEIPLAANVARGWGQHAVGALRAVLPAGRVADAFDASRQAVLLAETDRAIVDPVLGPPPRPRDDLDVLTALCELGYSGAVREVLVDRARHQDPRGLVTELGRDVTASTLAAARVALRLSPDAELAAALSDVVAQGARWLVEHDDLPLRSEGLVAARDLLAAVGASAAAIEVGRLLDVAPTASAGSEVATDPTSLLIPEPDGPLGLDLLATADSLMAEAIAQPRAAWDRLEALLEVASPTWSWPTNVHPKLHTGTGGAGHDLRITAAVARAIRWILVGDANQGELAVARHWPAAWLGHGVEVHGMPSCHGAVSWAVRWHGERPALLWDVEGGASDLIVTAPGLDAGWQGAGAAGEALLAPQELPDEPRLVSPDSGSFG